MANHIKILVWLNIGLNVASIVGGLLTVLIILGAMYLDKNIMDRVSIRFTLTVSIVDVVKALTILIYTEIHVGSNFCTLLSLFFHWLMLVYLFLNVSVALNLQLVLVHSLILGKWFEQLLWTGSFLIPTILMAISYSLGKHGLDASINLCEMRNPQDHSRVLIVWTTFLGWGIASLVYCTVAVLLVMISLQRKASIIDQISLEKVSRKRRHIVQEENIKLKQKIQKLIRRISLYCIIPVITQAGYLALRVKVCYTQRLPLYLSYLSVIGSDIPGVLNLFALLLDPAFSAAIDIILSKNKNGSQIDVAMPSINCLIVEEFNGENYKNDTFKRESCTIPPQVPNFKEHSPFLYTDQPCDFCVEDNDSKSSVRSGITLSSFVKKL